MKIGIIQSRGLGDILIALPIAKYWHDQGNSIVWPICEEFWPNVKESVPWVQWIPLPTDGQGQFFYNEPMKRLKALKCDEVHCFYQALNVVPELSKVPWFQIQKFDEFKYTKAGVPFLRKWSLADCIERDPAREQALYDRMVKQEHYMVYHTVGSTYRCSADLSNVPPEWQQIEISEETSNIFDWLKILEGAQALILIDSVFSNLVDQMQIEGDKYWIPRSHIHLTPVLGTDWTILDAPTDSLAAKPLFSPG
jgi:hypothetical protein